MDVRTARRIGTAALKNESAFFQQSLSSSSAHAVNHTIPPDDFFSAAEHRHFIQSPTPALDIDIILSYATGFDRSQLITHRDTQLTAEQQDFFFRAIAQRRTGFPVAYITGHKEFYGLDFIVTPAVLIPKPDTELLVEHAVPVARSMLQSPRRQLQCATPSVEKNVSQLRIADVCTGSGCIGLSVLHELLPSLSATGQSVQLMLTDISDAALSIARQNCARLFPKSATGEYVEPLDDRSLKCSEIQKAADKATNPKQPASCGYNVSFARGDLIDDACGSSMFDLILSNPPYIPAGEVDELLKDGRSEPRLALDGDTDSGTRCSTSNGLSSAELIARSTTVSTSGTYPAARSTTPDRQQQTAHTLTSDGLAIIRRLIPQAYAHLAPCGVFMLETGEYNAESAAAHMTAQGFCNVVTYRDLSGALRMTVGQK